VLPAIVTLMLLASPAPVEAQMPVLKKVLQFEHDWATDRAVLVVAATPDDAQALEITRMLAELSVKARIVTLATLSPSDDVLAVYATKSVPAQKVQGFARTNHYVSISWAPDDVEEGRASVCIGRSAADKPEIVINLSNLKAEGRMFNARVLRIAQVIP
jgi:hypothetical protein